MSILYDKFNIIENPKDFNKEDIIPLVDNYLENLLFCDEKIIHQDFFLSLSYYNIEKVGYIELISKHLENYLKQKRQSIRTNIKKGNFDMDTLIKLIENYSDKLKKIYQISNNLEIIKIASSQLYEQIILENSLTGFLKSELSTTDEVKIKSIFLLIDKMIDINNANSETKAYQWFLFLISSALSSTVEENFNKTFPVPQNYQDILNFSTNANFCLNIYNIYKKSPAIKELNIILCSSIKILIEKLNIIFDTCNLNQINKIMKSNFSMIDIIVNKLNLPIENKTAKEIITNKFFIIIDNQIKKINDTNFVLLKELTECFQTFDPIINNSGTTRDIIMNKIAQIFSTDITQNYLIEIIHKNIIININENHDVFINLLGFCSNIHDKDKFIDKYNRFLILRMINNPNMNVEKMYLHILIERFGEKLLFKTNKIINDTEYSIADINNYKKLIDFQDIKFNMITTSYNNWDINQQEGLVNINNENETFINSKLLTYLHSYQAFYKLRYADKRKLNWYLHFGEIVFEYLNKEIKMLPIQFIILEAAQQNTYTKEDLLNIPYLENYNLEFKQSLIASLLLGGILNINNNIISISSDTMALDYINIFFTTTNYSNIWEEKRQNELISTRKDVINTQINHFLKKSSLNKVDLFKKVSENIKVFKLDDELFDKSITFMIDNDYIKYNGDMMEKLLY